MNGRKTTDKDKRNFDSNTTINVKDLTDLRKHVDNDQDERRAMCSSLM